MVMFITRLCVNCTVQLEITKSMRILRILPKEKLDESFTLVILCLKIYTFECPKRFRTLDSEDD